MKKILALAFLSTLLMSFSCKEKDAEDEDLIHVEFGFGDSSVPPQYHRSYTLDIEEETTTLLIDSYGDTLLFEEFNSNGRLKKVQEIVRSSNMKGCKETDDDGCTGGTSVALTAETATGAVVDGYAYKCAGSYTGTICGDIDDLKSRIRDLFPEIASGLDKVEDWEPGN